jgi:hypothetical protein
MSTDLSDVESSAQELRFMAAKAEAWPLKVKLYSAGAVLVLLAGVLAWVYWPEKPRAEVLTPAPQVQQADGSMIAARAPDAHPPAPVHTIPQGYHEVRRDTVTVAPAPAAAASGCPPVRVDLSLVRNGADQRVIASSPDGQVVSAIDVPIEAAMVPAAPKPWAAGLSYGTRHDVGIWVDRDVGRLVVGGALSRLPDGKTEAQVRVGVRF